MVDIGDLKSPPRKRVRVRVSFPANFHIIVSRETFVKNPCFEQGRTKPLAPIVSRETLSKPKTGQAPAFNVQTAVYGIAGRDACFCRPALFQQQGRKVADNAGSVIDGIFAFFRAF